MTEELSEYNQEANNSITTDELTSFDIFPAELRKKDPKDEVTNLTQAQILPENESLHKILLALQKQSTDIEAVALISEDGMMVASVVPEALDKNSIVRLSSVLLSLGIRTSNEFDHGKVEQIIVHGEHGYTVMLRAGCSGAILLVITGEQAKLGLICFDMRNAFNNIETIL